MAGGESPPDFDPETGEPVIPVSYVSHAKLIRHLQPDETSSPSIALIDALAFSLVPPDGCDHEWLLEEMRSFLPIASVEVRAGYNGFKHSARFGDGAGLIAWGGNSQRGRVYFSIQGQGCSLISDWPRLSAWLEAYRASIRRVDVAHDDFDGKAVSIEWAVEQYLNGGFNAGGRQPKHCSIGDWLSGEKATSGRTLNIGSRSGGKLCRVYEKGKEQGNPVSPWARVEVEWRAQDRLIPLDVLARPGHYLAGAYPCLKFLSEEQSRIKTIAKGGTISFERAVGNGRQLVGKLVNLMLQVHGGDAVAVVGRLLRPGIPARVAPYSYHIIRNPELIDLDASEASQA
jgi:phage replication initiation protein